MADEYLNYLLRQYRLGLLSPEERVQLVQAFADQENEADILNWIDGEMDLVNTDAVLPPERAEKVFNAILAQEPARTGKGLVRNIKVFRRWWAAASIVALVAAGTYIWTVVAPNRSGRRNHLAEIAPGKQGAVLTLADGKQVELDSIRNGTIALQGGVTAKVINGELFYEGDGQEVMYNTISTSKGREYHMTLPDGSVVWLNSMSSIRYPTAFTGKERRVEITGEAYFEVAASAQKPFRVHTNNHVNVEVLGTRFNINAYGNEEVINTTLVNGRIRVNNVIIHPGQQALVKNHKESADVPDSIVAIVQNADIDKATAWKNGFFNFEDVKLDDAMRQLERWYDIKVVYENGVPDIELKGKLSKGVTLNELIGVLTDLGVNAQLKDQELSVSVKKLY
ncbi:FecR domain-containing protein [Chitinophaga sp.]|uniref:FecR domain-containing protein n=1 Tax=Chitinophaga sp. TaxID=1869181 RepID=UPI002CAC46B4|nr:FecR domain-containing protein [Chitinophaga sp.]HWV67961.1 FecR domain-containing protein [Chitinophaga sp.]